jgi:hypothetical protein
MEASSERIDVPSTGSFSPPSTASSWWKQAPSSGNELQIDLQGGENILDKLDSGERYVDLFADSLDSVAADVNHDAVNSNRGRVGIGKCDRERREERDKTRVMFQTLISGSVS